MELKLVVRSRGIILHEDKIFVVKHSIDFDYYALPGGHIEHNESPVECIEREILEELGVAPKIGRLLYVNSFSKDNSHSVEFFFEITNGEDYLDTTKLKGTHRHELFEIRWIDKNEEINLLPMQLKEDFKNGKILSDVTRFIK